MGIYLNPGNMGFKKIVEEDYIDKTGLIGLINKRIGTNKSLVCISRPRRFGKSYAAQMLCAYYDHTCDSSGLFSKYQIAGDASYKEHLNQYHVINLDIMGFLSEAKKNNMELRMLSASIDAAVMAEVKTLFPDLQSANSSNECLLEMVHRTKRQIVFVIDEWDSVIREAKDDSKAQDSYLNLLRGWFKNNNFTAEAVAAAYMTGILPIKKDESQSAISDFEEYSMLDPQMFAEYVGFTEEEVKRECEKRGASFENMKGAIA